VNSIVDAPVIDNIASLKRVRNIYPTEDESFLMRIDQLLDDLKAYRDDTHLDSFRNLDVSGPAWELFSNLWQNEISTVDEMVEKYFSRGRGVGKNGYQLAINILCERGWVSEIESGRYKISELGKQIRNDAERKTDHNFYRPWRILSADEINKLQLELVKMNKKLLALLDVVTE
jgi:hypothetical protein